MNIDDAVTDAVARATAPLADQVRRLADQVEALSRHIPHQFGSVQQAADLLGVSSKSVLRAVAAGTMQARRQGRRVLVDLSALRVPDGDELEPRRAASRGGR